MSANDGDHVISSGDSASARRLPDTKQNAADESAERPTKATDDRRDESA
jgi:hypothetical protein